MIEERTLSEVDVSESRLAVIAEELASQLGPRDLVLLEGQMGAGKSTFARALIRSLGVHQPAEGSPTFAIAHEYESARGEIIHIDFYRFKSEQEIDEAGATAYFWERAAIVLSEWTSAFADFERALFQSVGAERQIWRIDLQFGETPELRRVEITKYFK